MKKGLFLVGLVMVCIFGLSFSAHAVTLTLSWQANTESDLAGYRLFQKAGSASYDYYNPVWEGVETSCTHVFAQVESETYCYVLRAFDTSGNESGDSNEVCWTAPDLTPPANPQNLIIEAINLAINALEKLRDGIAMLDGPSLNIE